MKRTVPVARNGVNAEGQRGGTRGGEWAGRCVATGHPSNLEEASGATPKWCVITRPLSPFILPFPHPSRCGHGTLAEDDARASGGVGWPGTAKAWPVRGEALRGAGYASSSYFPI